MTIANNPYDMLTQAADLIQERGQGYGEVENNFQLISDLASLRIGREFHPYEVCIILECVKDARMFATPSKIDNYLDGINYKAFAALFAQDYEAKRLTLTDVTYKRKADLSKSEMKPVEIMPKPMKEKMPTTTKSSGATININDLEKEIVGR